MTKADWVATYAANVWTNGSNYWLYWLNKPDVSQHAVLQASSREYLHLLAGLAGDGFNPDFTVEGIDRFMDENDNEAELAKRGLTR